MTAGIPSLSSLLATADGHSTEEASFDTFLPFAKPTLGEEEIQEVVECLKSGWLATGPRVAAFSKALSNYVQAPHVLPVNSATDGLHLALQALDLPEGSEVITTPMTFIATLNVIVLNKLKPVLVDVEPGTYNMDMNRVEAAITPRTRAIMPVHFAGAPVDLDPLYELAQKHNLRVVEDAAHAIGTHYKERPIGSFGDIQVFSFHPNKNMTTGEGGAIVLRDDALAQKLSCLRFHGINREAWNRFGKSGSQHYDILLPGHKSNMMDLQAAIGLHQLKKLEGFIDRRIQLAQRYHQGLSGLSSLSLPMSPSFAHRHAWHLYAPLVTEGGGFTRDELMDRLQERNIGTGLHYKAAHLFSYYQETFGYREGDFPIAEKIGNSIFSLPLYPTLLDAEQDKIIQALHQIL